MVKKIFILLFPFLISSIVFASDIPTREQSTHDIQQKLITFFDQLAQENPNQSPDVMEARAVAHYGKGEPGLEYYKEASCDKSSPYKKSKTMETLYQLGEIATASVGTVNSSAQSSSLRQRATTLNQTGDPDFKQVAQYYNQEADDIDSGDYNAARSDAQEINAIPRADISNYQPTNQEQSFSNQLSSVAGQMLQSVASVAGTYALQTLLGAIGGPLGAMAGTALGPALTQVLSSLFGTNGNSSSIQDSSGQVLQNTGDQYTNALQQRLQQWAQQGTNGNFSNSSNNFSSSRNNFSNNQNQFSVDQTLQQNQQKSLDQIKGGSSAVAPGGVLPQ